MKITAFYDDLDRMQEAIDWPLMRAKYWHDTDEDNDRSRRRQAEFLVHRFLPWELIDQIGVYHIGVKARVEEMLIGIDHRPTVLVRRTWYY